MLPSNGCTQFADLVEPTEYRPAAEMPVVFFRLAAEIRPQVRPWQRQPRRLSRGAHYCTAHGTKRCTARSTSQNMTI
jgi:hypothetical protein